MTLDPYLKLLALIALLFFLPKILVRFGLPSPLTEMGLGLTLGPAVFGLINPTELLHSLSGFGISALFLFAGLEVEVHEIIQRRRTILEHLVIQAILIVAATWIGVKMGLSVPVAALVALAVMSSSVGFILTAMGRLGLSESVAGWIKHKAIATETMAVLMVLVFSNTASLVDTLAGLAGITALVSGIPLLFMAFHRTILRWAPGTEFSFVMIVALLAAYVTHLLGVHYLVGAFLVGLIARRYLDWSTHRHLKVPALTSALSSFHFFSAFFVPFFFFQAGLTLPKEAVTMLSLGFGLALCIAVLPVRIVSVMVHRRAGLGERWRDAANVGLVLGPTTVFSVAVAEILRERFDVAEWIVGGLIVYAAATSLLPLLTRRASSTEYEDLMDLYEGFALGTPPGQARR